MADFTKEKCIALLSEKHRSLLEQGFERLPKKSDFSEAETVAIKAVLGPWPRALEQAGLKSEKTELILKKQQKRIEAKRKKTLQKIENRKVSK